MSASAPPLSAHAHPHAPSGVGPDSGPDTDPSAELLAAPPPDPFEPPPDDDDSLFELEEEIASLSAHIDAAVHRLLTLIADFDRRGGWKIAGHRSCAHWLRFRTAVDLGTAREKVRTARALEHLPKISEEMSKGRLSFSQARALTRVATPESEEELLEVARSVTVSDLERFIRAWRVMSRKDEAQLERERHRSRALSVYPGEMGMYEVRGKVTAEVGAVLMRAVEAAGDALFTKESSSETTAKQRRADAIGLVAERALEAGFGGEADGACEPSGCSAGCAQRPNVASARPAERSAGETPEASKGVSCETRRQTSSRAPEGVPLSGSRAERYQVVLHVEPSTLARAGGGQPSREDAGPGMRESGGQREAAPSRSNLEDGTRLSCETSRRLACDSSLVRIERGENGEVLDVGRKTRTVPPAIRRALEVRDQGCVFPGCGLRFAEAHHVRHWADGGETKLDNLILLCRFHHRLLHEEGWRVVFRGGTSAPTFYDPRNHMHLNARPRSPDAPARPVKILVRENRRLGIDPDGSALTPRFTFERDVPLEVYERGFEALEGEAGRVRFT